MRVLIVGTRMQKMDLLRRIIAEELGCSPEIVAGFANAIRRVDEAQFDMVVVECVLPRCDGPAFVERLTSHERYRGVPVLVTLGSIDRRTRSDLVKAGATELLKEPIDAIELTLRIRNLLALGKARADLASRADWIAREIGTATAHLAVREEEFIWRLSRALEYRDGGTAGHISRVATVSRQIAIGLGLSDERCRTIYLAAPLHDIGKVAIPDSILGKAGRLDESETAIMRSHVEIGERILANGSSDLIHTASRIAAAHHERWDGAGYPSGISGQSIPIEGRIVAVADVFDALCSERPYKRPWPIDRARQELVENSGRQFDPECVEAFIDRWDQIERLYNVEGPVSAGKAAPVN